VFNVSEDEPYGGKENLRRLPTEIQDEIQAGNAPRTSCWTTIACGNNTGLFNVSEDEPYGGKENLRRLPTEIQDEIQAGNGVQA
jgi:hypothetical protein